MSVRFTATGQSYSSAASPPATTFTVTCWAYMAVNRANYSAIWASDQTGGATYLTLSSDSDGTTLVVFNSALVGSPITGLSMSTGIWYQLGFTLSGGTGTLYYGAAAGALTTASSAGFGAVTSPSLTIGDDGFGGDFWNGRIANFKHYSAALTATEIQLELSQYVPIRGGNLVRWHPFLAAGTADASGNGNTLSGGSGASSEDGPPIPWSTLPVQPATAALRRASNF